jgi:hypothetical protein
MERKQIKSYIASPLGIGEQRRANFPLPEQRCRDY